MTAPDSHLAQRARQLYEQAAQQLDPATSTRLHSARLQALATADRKNTHAHAGARWLLPSGACAVIVLAAVTLWQPLQQSWMSAPGAATVGAPGTGIDNELPPDAAQTDPQLYENLDFYGWLASNGRAGNRH